MRRLKHATRIWISQMAFDLAVSTHLCADTLDHILRALVAGGMPVGVSKTTVDLLLIAPESYVIHVRPPVCFYEAFAAQIGGERIAAIDSLLRMSTSVIVAPYIDEFARSVVPAWEAAGLAIDKISWLGA